jgi:hypothetical protein
MQQVLEATAHEHDWQLVEVEYDDGQAVRELCCSGCRAVTYE